MHTIFLVCAIICALLAAFYAVSSALIARHYLKNRATEKLSEALGVCVFLAAGCAAFAQFCSMFIRWM